MRVAVFFDMPQRTRRLTKRFMKIEREYYNTASRNNMGLGSREAAVVVVNRMFTYRNMRLRAVYKFKRDNRE